jgi:hypothetical protein
MFRFMINQYWGGTKMATYNQEQGLQSVLNAALGKYQSKGFRLTELGDHSLMLYYRDESVGVLSQGGATIPAIHAACREHLETLAS